MITIFPQSQGFKSLSAVNLRQPQLLLKIILRRKMTDLQHKVVAGVAPAAREEEEEEDIAARVVEEDTAEEALMGIVVAGVVSNGLQRLQTRRLT
jgi:hypothetical protein